jgi:hypothetical protein
MTVTKASRIQSTPSQQQRHEASRSLSVQQEAADPDSFYLAMRARCILSVSSHDESSNAGWDAASKYDHQRHVTVMPNTDSFSAIL